MRLVDADRARKALIKLQGEYKEYDLVYPKIDYAIKILKETPTVVFDDLRSEMCELYCRYSLKGEPDKSICDNCPLKKL